MSPKTDRIDFEVIRNAQRGCEESLSSLAQRVEPSIFTFLHRASLDYHLAEDLCQETLLDMVKSIRRLDLKEDKALWAWLYRTALGKLQHHFRRQGNKRIEQKTAISSDTIAQVASHPQLGPVNALQTRESIQAVLDAMAALRVEYRSVLTLRCLDGMSYAEMAGILGGTQLRARMFFYRAKKALQRQLTLKGLKRSHLLGALAVFAGVTGGSSKTASACIVGTASLEVGLPTAALATVATRLGILVTCLVVSSGILTGMTIKNGTFRRPSRPLDPYASLELLIARQRDQFELPSAVIARRDPDNNGFKAVDKNQVRAATPEEILLAEHQGNDFGLLLPHDHAVDLGFAGPLKDTPGPDFFITGWGCRETIQIFLTDGAGQAVELARPTCINQCLSYHVLPIDLEGLTLTFRPQAIRVQGFSNWGRHGGLELCSVYAKVEH